MFRLPGRHRLFTELALDTHTCMQSEEMMCSSGPHEVWCRSESQVWERATVTMSDGKGLLTLFLPDSEELREEVPLSAVCEVDQTHRADLPDITVWAFLLPHLFSAPP